MTLVDTWYVLLCRSRARQAIVSLPRWHDYILHPFRSLRERRVWRAHCKAIHEAARHYKKAICDLNAPDWATAPEVVG